MAPKKALVLVFLLLILGVSCGKKKWPQPNASQELFSIKIARCTRKGKCVRIKSRISGATQNLKGVALQMEELEATGSCPTCPFRVGRTFNLVRRDSELKIKGDILLVRICKLEKGHTYRFRLVGKNIHPELKDDRSEVFLPENRKSD